MLGPYPKQKRAPRTFERPEPQVKNMRYYLNFMQAINWIEKDFAEDAILVPAGYWQSVDVSKKPEMATYETMNVIFSVAVGDMSQQRLVEEIKPNMPWAEDHFQERIGGQPLNPGDTWKSWPYGHSADKFRNEFGQFNHNYMERYWPISAGFYNDGVMPPDEENALTNVGIRNMRYGDIHDVLDLFVRDPLTRQAYIPVFFPEDTGAHHRGRIPCTLGYHLIRRNDKLHISYYIRSCDLMRHFKDDIYLTVRLLQWILQQLKMRDPHNWDGVICGQFNMFITSLHLFRNDWCLMFGERSPNVGAINEYQRRDGNTTPSGSKRPTRTKVSGGGAAGSRVDCPSVGNGGGSTVGASDKSLGVIGGGDSIPREAGQLGTSALGGTITGRWSDSERRVTEAANQDQTEAGDSTGQSGDMDETKGPW